MDLNESEMITLISEDGIEHEFEVEAILEVDDEKYAVLVPMGPEYENSDEAVIMKFGNEDGEEILLDIESDEEWNMVADAYDEIIHEES